jgi:FkbM family methyltransferase
MEYVEKIQKRKLVLFGAGQNAAQIIATYFPLGSKIEFIVDNNSGKWGKTLLNIPIVSPDNLKTHSDEYVVLITIGGHYNSYSVIRQLKRMGIKNYYHKALLQFQSLAETYDSPWVNDFTQFNAFQLIEDNKDNISKVRAFLTEEKSLFVYDAMIEKMKYSFKDYSDICEELGDEYFNDGVFEYGDEEVFVDGGAYDGTDTIQFADMLGSRLKKAILFEPDYTSYLRTKNNLSKYLTADRYSLYNVGLSNKNTQAVFFSSGGEDARILENSTTQSGGVEIACFDNFQFSENITFIKLDIEGAELSALQGMAETIRLNKPKLAISLYHKTEDLWTLPLYIKQLVPEYRLFIRHHYTGYQAKELYATL